MSSSVLKPRSGYSGFGREQIKKHKREDGGGGNFNIEGRYDRWSPSQVKMWVSICPTQEYTYLIWDREQKAVVEQTTTYLAYKEHYVGATKRRFVCSAGPYVDKPCYGHSERQKFFDEKRREQDEQGYNSEKYNGYPPISDSQRFALSISAVEPMGQFPSIDHEGNVRKSKKGTEYTDWLPLSAPKVKNRKDMKLKKFGHKFHWSFGVDHLNALGAENERLSTLCCNCGQGLIAIGWAPCIACETENPFPWEQDIPTELLPDYKQEIAELHGQTPFECQTCGMATAADEPPELLYSCTGCSNPEPGDLFSFELNIGSESEDDHTPKIYNQRPRKDRPDVDKYIELIQKPLDLVAIFQPEKLEWQRKMLSPKMQQGATPDAHLKAREERDSTGTEGLGEGADNSEVAFLDDTDNIPY